MLPTGILCPTTQIAQKSSRERIVIFLADILKSLRVEFLLIPVSACQLARVFRNPALTHYLPGANPNPSVRCCRQVQTI